MAVKSPVRVKKKKLKLPKTKPKDLKTKFLKIP